MAPPQRMLEGPEDDAWRDLKVADSGFQFCYLPEDTLFLESACHNDVFDPHNAYAAIQKKDRRMAIYRMPLQGGSKAELVMEFISPDAEEAQTAENTVINAQPQPTDPRRPSAQSMMHAPPMTGSYENYPMHAGGPQGGHPQGGGYRWPQQGNPYQQNPYGPSGAAQGRPMHLSGGHFGYVQPRQQAGGRGASRSKQVKDGDLVVGTPFGSKLSDKGVLWVCCFNKNMLAALDLKTNRVLYKADVPAPNDLCLDPTDETLVYAACGEYVMSNFRQDAPSKPRGIGTDDTNAGRYVNPAFGCIYRVTCHPNATTTSEIVAAGTKALAGMLIMSDKLWFSMLVDISAVPLETLHRRLRPDIQANKVWRGYDKKMAYLADNVASFDDIRIVIPCYRSVHKYLAKMTEIKYCGLLGWGSAKLATSCFKCCVAHLDSDPTTSFSAADAALELADPSVDASFVEGDIFPTIHFVILNTQNGQSKQYRMPFPKHIQKEFDGHVTHIERAGTKLMFINYLKKQVLMIPLNQMQQLDPLP